MERRHRACRGPAAFDLISASTGDAAFIGRIVWRLAGNNGGASEPPAPLVLQRQLTASTRNMRRSKHRTGSNLAV